MQGILLDLPLQPHCCISVAWNLREPVRRHSRHPHPAPPRAGSGSTATETCKQFALDISECWALSQLVPQGNPGSCKEGVFLSYSHFSLLQPGRKRALGHKPKSSLSLPPQPCRVCLRPEFSLKEQEAELLQQAGHFPFLRKGHPGGAVFYVLAEAICLQMSPAGRLSHTIS